MDEDVGGVVARSLAPQEGQGHNAKNLRYVLLTGVFFGVIKIHEYLLP